MATTTKYPGTLSQSTGGNYREFKNLNNLKNQKSGNYATSDGNIRAKNKSPNRPSTITATNFHFNLPVGADITSVKVNIAHRVDRVGKTHCQIPKPVLSLVGVSGTVSKAAYAPPVDKFGHQIYTFPVKQFKQLTRNVVNSSNFGVKINYGANLNEYEGRMTVAFIRVQVVYKVPSFTVSVKKLSGGYNDDRYSVVCSMSNKNKVKTSPSGTLTAPDGFTFVESSGAGSVTKVNPRTLVWQPGISGKSVAYREFIFDVDVTFAAGTDTYQGIFTFVESLNQATSNYTAVIYRYKPVDEETEEASDDIIIATADQTRLLSVKQEEFQMTFKLTDEEWEQAEATEWQGYNVIDRTWFFAVDNGLLQIYQAGAWEDMIYFKQVIMDPETHETTQQLRAVGAGHEELQVMIRRTIEYDGGYTGYEYETLANYQFEVAPLLDDLGTPYYTLLKITGEELYRLGDGVNYTVQSDVKHDTSDEFVRDWYHNNRIGVFNNPILENITVESVEDPETGEVTETYTDSTDYDNLSGDTIVACADYWGEGLVSVNEFNNSTCEFTFKEDYPLYVILAGDYPESVDYNFDPGTTTFDSPNIIEADTYKERLKPGTYPISLINLLPDHNEDVSNLILEGNGTGDAIIIYDYDLDEGYGTNEQMVVRGIELNADISYTDNLNIVARLLSPDGEVGTRSAVLMENEDEENETLVLGGLGDLWNYKPSQLTNLEDFEIELIASNTLNDEESIITFNNVQLVIYVENLFNQRINVTIEDESLAAYGAFVETVNIPEGLITDTSYLTIAGTDLNDAYRQNIREKKITLEMSLNDCEIESNTLLLQQLTQLFVNEKDEYNRPIPKRITFSHYPNVVFEYIMEDALDISGDAGAYTVKADLVIPAGTSYSKKEIVTNVNGIANGLASVNPVITVKASEKDIIIKEVLSEQSFNMSLPADALEKVIEIDCEDRKVYLKEDEDEEGVDISGYVDMGVDWFRLHGEYEFESNGCVIRTISFYERW